MSQIEVDKIIPQSGTSTQLGESGDTITIPAGATITNNGTANGFGSADTEKVKVSTNDTTAGFLNGKLVAGTNISLTEGNDGGNETLTAALSGTIATAQIADDAVTLAKMASGTDGNIISYDASGNPVAVATGSAGQVLTSAGAGAPPTFAAAAGVNTPAFNIDLNATQNVSNLTNTKVALNTARIDTDSGFDSSNNRWTVPSGKGGTYYVGFELNGASGDGNSQLNFLACELKINGSSYIGTNIDFRNNPARECKVNANFIIALSAGDYLEIFGNNYVAGGQAYFGGGNSNAERNKSHLYGFRII